MVRLPEPYKTFAQIFPKAQQLLRDPTRQPYESSARSICHEGRLNSCPILLICLLEETAVQALHADGIGTSRQKQ